MSRRKTPPDDSALIRACLDGDESAWEALIRRYQRLVYSIPVSRRIPAAESDEIFQRVALKLFEKLGTLRKVDSLASWLMTTTRRETQVHIHRSKRFRPLDEDAGERIPDELPDPVGALDAIRAEHTLGMALERMGDPCHGLLSALYVEAPTPSYEQIAERLGRPVGSLGPTRARCLKKLRKLYVELGGEPP